ncbi:MAG: hypothetical protein JXQ91_19565 [Vannielia sp.]|uniref:hypothetical protein n=1 Tax=Vannielia sp. TaxID=2813045 RepID=UPI003B8C71AE
MQLLNTAILLVFGFGTAALAAVIGVPHWLLLIPAYSVGSILGLGAIWLVYALPYGSRRTPIAPVESAKTG